MEDSRSVDLTADRGAAPRALRKTVMLTALVSHGQGRVPVRYRVHDLTAEGVGLRGEGRLTVGEEVVVSIGAIDSIVARVCWVRPNAAGLAFVGPIDTARACARPPSAPRADVAVPAPRPTGVVPTAGWLANRPDAHRA